MNMLQQLKTISQTGIKALIKERIENPELYTDKPLFIWQAAWHDGIQQEVLLHVCRDFSRGKNREDRSIFRLTTVGDGENHLNKPEGKFEGRVAGYVITTSTLSAKNYLREVSRLIEENKGTLPLIVYLPYRYEQRLVDETCFETEHRIFAPDFNTWAEAWKDSTIPDFIRGNGDKAGITYRWYNSFNDPNKGCSTPCVWLAVSSYLNGVIKLTKNSISNYSITDIDEDIVRSTFQSGMNASKGHISDDVIDDFVKYLRTMAHKDRGSHTYEMMQSYSLSLINGVLKIGGASFLSGNIIIREYEWGLERKFESPFVHLDFHTAVVGEDIKCLCEGCFNGCKNLRKIILPHTIETIESPIANDTDVEYFEENGLLFLGPENNSRLALMGCRDDFADEKVIIPADTKVLADNVEWPLHVKELIYSDGTIIPVNGNFEEATGDNAFLF